jgi:exonuclease III
LNHIHPDFVGFGLSAMCKKLSAGIYCDRPFRGDGFIWRKSMSKYAQVIGSDDNDRCLAIVINFIDHDPITLFNVYFPYYSASIQFNVELGNCLRFMESLLQPTDDVIIVGDVNFTCSIEHTGFVQYWSLLDRLSIAH